MLAAVKIKEEPLEAIEELQEMFKQQEAFMEQQIIMDKIKDELHAESLPLNNFQIVDEQESIITVSAGSMKSEDELQFIENFKNSEHPNFNGVCSKCLKRFSNRSQFLKHTKRNHCTTKQKCPVCPVTFIDAASLLNHLKFHQDNFFFCSQHCGANFKTLPLCEEHELKEHKMQNPPKIRYKHFCSFCREGFKTELQLHVHWLQQNQGCGKLMQDVIIHSNNVANNNNNGKNNFSSNNKQKDQSPTTNTVTTIPITKLRLKSSSAPLHQTIKRQHINEEIDKDIALKRTKLFNQIKANIELTKLPFNFETNVEIKEEPIDEDEHNNVSGNLIPEVIIKTEDDKMHTDNSANNSSLNITNDSSKTDSQKDNKPEMKSLFINNMMNPEFNGKIIPMTVHSVPNKMPVLNWVNNNNINNNTTNTNTFNNSFVKTINSTNTTSLKNLANLKLIKFTPTSIASSNRNIKNFQFSQLQNGSQARLIPLQFANTGNINNGNVIPLPKAGLQIIKFLPNTQLLTFQPMNQSSNTNLGETKQPMFLKLQPNPTLVTQQQQQPSPILVQHQQIIKPISSTTPPPLVLTSLSKTKKPPKNPSAVSIKLNSLDHNTVIDAEDFKKLQAEALIKSEEHRKNFVIPKERLTIIENMPENKQIIDSMKKQIAEVENNSEVDRMNDIKNTPFVLNDKNVPTSLYLPILTPIDVELEQARYEHPGYIYKWICPYCLKDYEVKRALRSHLTKAHNLNLRDMEKINVQAKAFRNEELTGGITSDIKTEIIQTAENGSMEADNLSSVPTTSPIPIKMTAFKTTKPIHKCGNCGRVCSSKTMLRDHILANCSREPQYPCMLCPKKFYSHGTLQCHMSIHTGVLPHKCSYCDKRFRTRGQVTVHHRTHTGERPFICQVCSQRFTHRETLIAHLSRHIGMKRYKCYGCDKHFSCISALKTHRDLRADSCGKVKFNPRAIGPRVRVIRGNVVFEAQPEINPYLKSEDPKMVLSELQNQPNIQNNIKN